MVKPGVVSRQCTVIAYGWAVGSAWYQRELCVEALEAQGYVQVAK